MKGTGSSASPSELSRAYDHCRAVARHEAKNFYFAFLALPPHKRNAMCAMYAFMRRADDIADDESMSPEKRRVLMSEWRDAFFHERAISPQDHLVFTAVRDTQAKFGIADQLLDELVSGTAMDLQVESPPGVERVEIAGRTFDVYTNIDALDRYCYLVASVVGLVTIRIFGVRGSEADGDAIAMGKAFQYTNILRDVREDSERGRIYLPLSLLEEHGAELADVVSAASNHKPSIPLLAAMNSLAVRAESFYEAERRLIQKLEPDSRGAMRTLIDIYHALLRRIEHAHLQVFQQRIRVSTAKKVQLLLRGMLLRSNA